MTLKLGFKGLCLLFFLLLQIAWIIYSQWSGNRFFAWTPNDVITEFQLELTIGDQEVRGEDIYRFCGFQERGFYDLPADHVEYIILKSLGQNAHNYFILTYHWRENGRSWHSKIIRSE